MSPKLVTYLSFIALFGACVSQNTPIGKTTVFLDGDTCTQKECNLGNFLTEAFAFELAANHEYPDSSQGNIAFMLGSRIKRSVETDTDITKDTLKEIMPYGEKLSAARYKGSQILEALAMAANENYTEWQGSVQFLQMYGIRVWYDFEQKVPEQRVISAQVLCRQNNLTCPLPTYRSLDPNIIYSVVLGEHLLNGNNGFKVFTNPQGVVQPLDLDDYMAVQTYVQLMTPIQPMEENRIKVDNADKAGGGAAGLCISASLLVAIILGNFV